MCGPGWIHSSLPSAQISFFQIGTTSLSVSISQRHASNESLTVRAAHGDDHAHFAQIEVSHAMDERQLDHRPASPCLFLELGHLLERHLGVGFIGQRDRATVAGDLADGSQKRANGPRQRGSHAVR